MVKLTRELRRRASSRTARETMLSVFMLEVMEDRFLCRVEEQ